MLIETSPKIYNYKHVSIQNKREQIKNLWTIKTLDTSETNKNIKYSN